MKKNYAAFVKPVNYVLIFLLIIFASCSKSNNTQPINNGGGGGGTSGNTAISFKYDSINQITYTGASLYFSIQSGESNVVDRGMLYSTVADLSLNTAKAYATLVSGNGTYRVDLTGLMSGTTYYFKPYLKDKSGKEYLGTQSQFSMLAHIPLKSSLSFRGINWADPNGNEGKNNPNGIVLPSGLSSSLTPNQAAAVAKNIADAVKTSGGTTIRMPITYGTTNSSSYWPVYQAAINAVVTEGCNVILCFWDPVGGTITNSDEWKRMWGSVDAVYKNNASVLYEPINEPHVYNANSLLTVYAGFIATFNPLDGKCVFDGTGYASDVTTIGGDTRLNNQYLGFHCYWWFWPAYTVWTDAYNNMKTLVGKYASHTIITEVGVETFRTFDFWKQTQTNAENDVAFLNGALAFAKDSTMGSIAWSGVNDIDRYRWFFSYSNLTEVNNGCANMFRWSWGLPEIWNGALPNGTYKLQNRATGLYIDSHGLTANSSNIFQNTGTASNNQSWEISYVNGYYWVYSLGGGLCADAGTNTTDGSNILQMLRDDPGNPNNSQQWTLVSVAGGYYKIINRSTGKCLDSGGQTTDGSALQQASDNGSTTQQWTIVQQ